ncbi:MAG: alkaline phosphatase D family protein [Sphingobacteriales bacterium]|jgi:alkaline phosphatase D|nr:alkaline phosphatase D family protein [Sphingobacteriales bacterium]MBP9141241.1 alkaline phosphatase D family protein [Chitinophagales bacterium]MDA0197905.1 alkaline phosphatase D family protein [Bacteroidota bacterium]MBK6890865.1 alkaline phosphatase D family protein [Sphingobacteriales bacterium]MBK7526082.1 alkaline phosphatase D family protein [Sphingobacteriales bacterium]
MLPIRLLFVVVLLTVFLSFQTKAQYRTDRLDPDPALAPFYHGVASGDPTANSVIIWTRLTTTDTASQKISWEIATDTAFTNIIDKGAVNATAQTDYCIKVAITSLASNTYYYYRFKHKNAWSLTGRTKTAPSTADDVTQLRFGVVSCAGFGQGYFNAYRHLANRNDVDAIIHLGDYLYEYADGQYGNIRMVEPGTEIISLDDYRIRHSHYKLDPDLRRLHQLYPFMSIWDDHETANNSWYGGAGNHNSDTEGDWFERKSAGIRAYNEWMPINPPDQTDEERIYRTANYGKLADIILLDTRLEGRDMQAPTTIDSIALLEDRTILGKQQLDWLTNQMANSQAEWKIIAQQVMMAPLGINGVGLNPDQWDGYPADRKRFYDIILDNNVKNVVVLTGDIHSSFANDLPYKNDTTYVPATGEGSVAVEMVATSITSPGMPIPGGEGLAKLLNPHIKYANLSQHGYILLDLNPDRAQGDWYYVNTIASPSDTGYYAAGYFVAQNQSHLQPADTLAPPPNSLAIIPPVYPYGYTGINSPSQQAQPQVLILGAYPNPFTTKLYVQYYRYQPNLAGNIYLKDVMGKTVFSKKIVPQEMGLCYEQLYLPDALLPGVYVLQIELGNKKGLGYSKMVVK